MDIFQVLFLNLKSIFHRVLIAPKKLWSPRLFLPPGPELLNLLLQLSYVDLIVIVSLHKQINIPVYDVSHPTGPTFSFNFCFVLRKTLRKTSQNFAMRRGIIVVYPWLESSIKWLT